MSRGRPADPPLFRLKNGNWATRITVESVKDPTTGKWKQKKSQHDLGTKDKAEARGLIAQIGTDWKLPPKDSFKAAAARILKKQGIVTLKEREARLDKYVYPHIGGLAIDTIRAVDVRKCVQAAKDTGRARETCSHVLHDVSTILKALWRAEKIPENVAAKVSITEFFSKRDGHTKQRAVLTDSELVQYLAWQHPDPKQQPRVMQRQLMLACSRLLGGQRTSDLHALTWDCFEQPGFAFASVASVKTGTDRKLAVPESLRAALVATWEAAGKPASGALFTRDDGEAFKKQSHARALRADLRKAFGIDELKATGRGGPAWREERKPTAREAQLLDGDARTLPVDFHSARRAHSQALARSGMNEQQAMAITGHESESAHRRYLQLQQQTVDLPSAAVPATLAAGLPNILSNIQVAAKAKSLKYKAKSGDPNEI